MSDKLTRGIIGTAIDIHKTLGPGSLESAYQECLFFELKTVEQFTDVHFAQIMTYLKLGNFPKGILINFHTKLLTSGIKCFINTPL